MRGWTGEVSQAIRQFTHPLVFLLLTPLQIRPRGKLVRGHALKYGCTEQCLCSVHYLGDLPPYQQVSNIFWPWKVSPAALFVCVASATLGMFVFEYTAKQERG